MASGMAEFEWHPAALFRQTPEGKPSPFSKFALVILNQPLTQNAPLDILWNNACLRVAADGGANRLLDLDRATSKDGQPGQYNGLDVIIGDLDSLSDSTRAYYSSRPQPTEIIYSSDQESTDFGKAVSLVRSRHGDGADIIALGGLGGRVDQGLSQIHHLYLFQPGPAYELGRVFLLSGQSLTFLLKRGKHAIQVRDGAGADVFGKHVGILPIGGTSRITTHGLEWDVTDWETYFGGPMSTSNHVLPDTRVVHVETTTDVIFTIALAGTQ
ncbi:thiamine pyrophosphokinase [Plectosphaerella plurivora]|uniref:Thiamine pyrophosphokinase n=1 Tax=Plectosphaerella plurivora TaxID=936078 RepID=A0A9P8V1U2_9PEZI|nr:thiamine pyrophosphokinase [Plectosphaerella plurivora]